MGSAFWSFASAYTKLMSIRVPGEIFPIRRAQHARVVEFVMELGKLMNAIENKA